MLEKKESTLKTFSLSVSIGLLYAFLGYAVQRHEGTLLLSSCALLFLLLYVLFKSVTAETIHYWLGISILIRVILLFSIPALSDDFYRFIWDGRLLNEGVHPFAEIPSFYMQEGNNLPVLTPELYARLNSKEYFTIYPPFTQFIFWLSTVFTPKSVFGSLVVLKLLILAAEFGSLLLLRKLLLHFSLPSKNILLYALNPLVVLELMGNVHFEAFVIFFLLLSVYLLLKQSILGSALTFSFAVSIKLLPLIFLPSLLPYLGIRKASQYYFIVGLTSLILFLPLWDTNLFLGMKESLSYYFAKFEFNASVYYIVREWGFWKYGYNIIQTIGWKLGLFSASFILVYSWRNFSRTDVYRNPLQLFSDWSIILTLYLLFTTTVHPWYITPLVAFCVFSNFKFTLVWSAMILTTYLGYSTTSYTENLWLVGLEYVAVLAFLLLDLKNKKVFFTKD